MNGSVAVRTGNINTVLFKMFLRGFFKNVLYIGIPRDLDIFTFTRGGKQDRIKQNTTKW